MILLYLVALIALSNRCYSETITIDPDDNGNNCQVGGTCTSISSALELNPGSDDIVQVKYNAVAYASTIVSSDGSLTISQDVTLQGQQVTDASGNDDCPTIQVSGSTFIITSLSSDTDVEVTIKQLKIEIIDDIASGVDIIKVKNYDSSNGIRGNDNDGDAKLILEDVTFTLSGSHSISGSLINNVDGTLTLNTVGYSDDGYH